MNTFPHVSPYVEFYVHVNAALMFFQSALALFTNFNEFLQREDPLIHLIHSQMNKFMNKLAGKFMKRGVIQAFKESGKSFDCFDPTFPNQLDDNELSIGLSTKLKLKQLVEYGYMDDNGCDF